MKNILIIIILVMASNLSSAQGTNLTKEETINYIQKKLSETVGHYKTSVKSDGTTADKNYYWQHSIRINGEKVTIRRTRSNYTDESISSGKLVYHQNSSYKLYPCNYYEDLLEQDFNPMHMVSVELLKDPVSGEPIGSIKLNLKANTAQSKTTYTGAKFKFPDGSNEIKSEYWGKCYGSQETEPKISSVSYIYVNFLAADSDNFAKLKKAFEYLRDLFKAEDDPFSN